MESGKAMTQNFNLRELSVALTRKDMWWTDDDGYFHLPTVKPVSDKEIDAMDNYNEKWYEYLKRVYRYHQLSKEDKKLISYEECIILKGDEILEDGEISKAVVYKLKMVNGEPKIIHSK